MGNLWGASFRIADVATTPALETKHSQLTHIPLLPRTKEAVRLRTFPAMSVDCAPYRSERAMIVMTFTMMIIMVTIMMLPLWL
jgi:hypothetical protein